MLSKEEVKHIAKLARLGLTEKEIGKFQKELSSILDYIEKLKKVDVSNINPTSHPLLIKNIIRKDHAQSSEKFGRASVEKEKMINEKLLNLAPEVKGKHLKVKSILKEKS